MHDKRLQRVAFLTAMSALTLLLAAPGVFAADTAVLFVEPPAPQTLARILYGPRYRTASAPSDERFGMLIHFELDSTRVVPASLPLLDSIGEMLKLEGVEREVLVIEGHADARGTHAYNQGLSTRRAAAIKRYLVDSFDIAAARLVTVGMGETVPRDPDDGENPVNRRVEFRAVRSIVVD